jgi:hypothetical protein
MSTVPTIDDQVLDDLDFDPALPCESVTHKELGHSGIAEWVVTLKPHCECPATTLLACDGCLSYWLTLTETRGWIHDRCGRLFVASFVETILATERIR